MKELTATQRIRLAITNDPDGELQFQHEGPNVIRWITGGTMPTAYVKFRQQGNQIIASCPQCDEELGKYDSIYTSNTCQELKEIRANGIEHQRRHGFPYLD